MKIYTKTGDCGQTDLWGGGKCERRVFKNHLRVEAIGAIDEVNAHLGLCIACPLTHSSNAASQDVLLAQLITLQTRLFELGADIANLKAGEDPSLCLLPRNAPTELEAWIDAWDALLPPLRHFILPGGCERSARLHVARVACRRAERTLVSAAQSGESLPAESLVFINRLSDLLFVMARAANRDAGTADVKWPGKSL